MQIAAKSLTPRHAVISFLRYLCATEESNFTEPTLPITSLFELWFNEIYTPSATYFFNELKGDHSEEKLNTFNAHFTPEELQALEQFHQFLTLRLEIAEKLNTLNDFHQSTQWQQVVKDAGYALEALEG